MPNKYQAVVCPHCEAENLVRENGRYVCNECQGLFDVDWFSVRAVEQPDGVSCGWATTLWLLRSFGFNPDPVALREELNTDGKHGLRGVINGVLGSMGDLFGTNWRNAGTLPTAIYSALSKRGLTIKNPIRPESPAKFIDYLNETMDEGGRGIVLLWRMDFSLWHWMGVDRKNGVLRIMDPFHGWYVPFEQAITGYKRGKNSPRFLVVGIVRR